MASDNSGEDELFVEILGSGGVRKLHLRREIAAGLDEVWAAITQLEFVQQWWPDWQPGGVIEGEVGGNIKLADGSWIDGEIKTFAVPHVFEFVWAEYPCGQHPDWFEPSTQSSLRIDLVATSEQSTLLNLVQFSPADMAAGGSAGWHHFAGELLVELLEQGACKTKTDSFDTLLNQYEQVGVKSSQWVQQNQAVEISGRDSQRLELQVAISAPIEAVWQGLTQVEHVKHWWVDGDIQLFEGGAIVLQDENHIELTGVVRLCLSPHVFEFQIINAIEGDQLVGNGLVRFDLTPIGEQNTHLTLTCFASADMAQITALEWQQRISERLKPYLQGEFAG